MFIHKGIIVVLELKISKKDLKSGQASYESAVHPLNEQKLEAIYQWLRKVILKEGD